MQQLAATLGARGFTAEEVENYGGQAYETISQQLPELSKLSAMYEKTDQAKNAQQLQQELESEQILGMASQRRRKLEERNLVEFMGSAGRASTSRKTAGLI
jgi:peptide subunit release factor 1 (eRF1)